MKKLTRAEMKNIKGGDQEATDIMGDDGTCGMACHKSGDPYDKFCGGNTNCKCQIACTLCTKK